MCGGRGGGEFGRGSVWVGQVSRTGQVPFLNFWIPCCQMFAVNNCLCVWGRCTCLVSCPLHRHLFWTALAKYNSTGIYSQNVTSSSGPTRVPVRYLRQPGFLHMTKTTVICFGWTWQSSELCRLQVLWYSSVLACTVVNTDFSPCDLHSVMW